MSDKEYFKGVCPYTGKPCKIWLCRFCRIEYRERVWMKMLDKEKEE